MKILRTFRRLETGSHRTVARNPKPVTSNIHRLILLLITLTFLPTVGQEAIEDTTMRTTYQKVFVEGRNQYRAKLYSAPIHYLDNSGIYREIESSLTASSLPGYDYEVTKGLYRTYYKNDPTANDAIRIEHARGNWISFRMAGAGYYETSSKNYQLFPGLDSGTVAVSNNEILYEDMLPGLKMKFKYLNSRLKEDLIITQTARNVMPLPSTYGYDADSTYLAFVMELRLDDALQAFVDSLRVDEENGGIRQLNFEGNKGIALKRFGKQLRFFLPTDFAYHRNTSDSSLTSIDLKRRIITRNGKIYVVSGVPYNWINSLPQGRVVIDPAPVVSNIAEDTWLEFNSVKGDEEFLIVGKSGVTPKKRSLLKFDLSGLPTQAHIDSAEVQVYYGKKHRPSGSSETFINRVVQAHAVYTAWDEATADYDYPWNVDYGDFGSGQVSGTDYEEDFFGVDTFTSIIDVWKTFDMTTATRNWHNNLWPNNGVVLWATNEDTVGYDVRMVSSEYDSSAYHPNLDISYTLPTVSKAFYIKDHLGSTRVVMESDGDIGGNIIEAYDYYPFGLNMPARTFISGGGDTRNLFTGKERDSETNWDYFGARYYDPAIARWLSVDPLSEEYPSIGSFVYVANNPIYLIDPNGKELLKAAGHFLGMYSNMEQLKTSGMLMAAGHPALVASGAILGMHAAGGLVLESANFGHEIIHSVTGERLSTLEGLPSGSMEALANLSSGTLNLSKDDRKFFTSIGITSDFSLNLIAGSAIGTLGSKAAKNPQLTQKIVKRLSEARSVTNLIEAIEDIKEWIENEVSSDEDSNIDEEQTNSEESENQ